MVVLEALTRSTVTASHGAVEHHQQHTSSHAGGDGHAHAHDEQEQQPALNITISNERGVQLSDHGAGDGAGTDLTSTGNTSTV